MWVRKRIDIGWPDIAMGVLGCCRPYDEAAVQRKVESHWTTAGGALACLSVRTGCDLLLAALDLPAAARSHLSAHDPRHDPDHRTPWAPARAGDIDAATLETDLDS